MRIARKLDAVVALLGVVVSLAAICPCMPAAPSRHGQAAGDEHACCAARVSPALVAASDTCCLDHGLTDRSAAALSAAPSLSLDVGVATLVTWNRSAIGRPLVPRAVSVSHPPSILRI